MFIDSHCHLNSIAPAQRKEIIKDCSRDCVLIDSGIDLAACRESLAISGSNSFIYSALGFHPFSVDQFNLETLNDYRRLFEGSNKKIAAIGEIGLDMYANFPEKQESILKQFIGLATEKNLAIVIHNRTKDLKIFDILNEFYKSYEKVVLHCFSSDVEFLKRIADKGGFVSFSLNILRKKEELMASLKYCPQDNILLETDSPYMKVNGTPSSPLNIKEVYEFAAKIRGEDAGKLQACVTNNIKRAFKALNESLL